MLYFFIKDDKYKLYQFIMYIIRDVYKINKNYPNLIKISIRI